MKLTGKEREILGMLRELDGPQRDKLLADTRRAVEATRIIARVGKLKRLRPVADHKIIRAYGKVPWRRT